MARLGSSRAKCGNRRSLRAEPLEPRRVLAAALAFNEIMYHPPGDGATGEWIELHNQMAVDLDISGWRIDGGIKFEFPAEMVVPGGGYVVVAADPAALAMETGFSGALGPFAGRLSNSGEELRLYSHMAAGVFSPSLDGRRLMDAIDYRDDGLWPVAADGSGATLAKVDGDAGNAQPESWTFSWQAGGTPGAENFGGRVPQSLTLSINEVASSADASFRVELVNHGDSPALLDGVSLRISDTAALPYSLAGRPSLAPGEYLVIDRATLGFQIDSGDRLFLYADNGDRVIDAVRVEDTPRALFQAGDGRWLTPDTGTFGAANSFSLTDNVVINEIMFHDRAIGATAETPFAESDEEWIELYNRGTTDAELTGWTIGGGINFAFAPGTMIASGEYLVVAKDRDSLTSKHPGIVIAGNYSGSLSNSNEWIELRDPSGNPADEVHYYDGGRWDAAADGGGASLELRNPHADNSVAEAWAASDELGSSEWNTYSYRGIALEDDGIGNNAFHEFVLGLLDAGEVLLDDISVIEDPDGAALEFLQNGRFENDTVGALPQSWRIIGTHGSHGRSAVVLDPDDGTNQVLHLVATGPTEDKHNQAGTTYAGGERLVEGREYEISFRAMWLSGSNRLNTRLYFNFLQQTTAIDVPNAFGTPGRLNSRYEENTGPTYSQFHHFPVVPASGEPVAVSVVADDPHSVASMTLVYSFNEGRSVQVPMTAEAGNRYVAQIPGGSPGQIAQFYVEGQDGLGAVSTYPAAGADSRALYIVRDGRADLSRLHNVRILMTNTDRGFLWTETNRMSNDRIAATVVYDERIAYYDVGVRLKGSAFGRNNNGVQGLNVRFHPDQLFRGVHESIAIERAGNLKEILAKHMFDHAAGGLGSSYDDISRVIFPASNSSQVADTAILAMSRNTDVFLESWHPGAGKLPLYNMELLYSPTGTINGDPQAPKRNFPYTHTNGRPDIEDLGDSKEHYRWNFQMRNARALDDYRPLVALAKAFELPARGIESPLDVATRELMDVDQWMRTFAMMSLNGNDDFYTRIWEHNFRMMVRPEDGRLLALPWDMDRAFQLSTTASLWGGLNLQRVIEIPSNRRLYFGHLLNLIDTTVNRDYMQRWTQHYSTLTGDGFAAQLSYIDARSNFVLSRLPAPVPFVITTNGGNGFDVNDVAVELAGNGWIDVREIRLAGSGVPLDVEWTGQGAWRLTVPLALGSNTIQLEAYNHVGQLVGSDPIQITSTAADRPLEQSLRITEIMYDPAAPPAGSPFDSNDFEYLELTNTGPTDIDLRGSRLIDGVSFDFSTSAVTTLGPGQFVVVVRNRDAFQSRYGDEPAVAGQYTGRLANEGENIGLATELGATILDFSYSDTWFPSTNGTGRSLVIVDAHGPADSWGDRASWTPSVVGGSPGRADPVGPPGDTNGDGRVDIDDLNNVRNNFGGNGLGDTNGDGRVDIDDLNNVRNNFGSQQAAGAAFGHLQFGHSARISPSRSSSPEGLGAGDAQLKPRLGLSGSGDRARFHMPRPSAAVLPIGADRVGLRSRGNGTVLIPYSVDRAAWDEAMLQLSTEDPPVARDNRHR